jgi:hypothetical protein
MKSKLVAALFLISLICGCATAKNARTEHQADVRHIELQTRFDNLDRSIKELKSDEDLEYEVRDLNRNRPVIGWLTTKSPVSKGETLHLDDDVYIVEEVIDFAISTKAPDGTKNYEVGNHRLLVKFDGKENKAPKD